MIKWERDTMCKLAGLASLGYYCDAQMAPSWCEFLYPSDVPKALASAPQSGDKALITLHMILPTHSHEIEAESAIDQDRTSPQSAITIDQLPMMDIGPEHTIASSRAFKLLQLVKWDEILFTWTADALTIESSASLVAVKPILQ